MAIVIYIAAVLLVAVVLLAVRIQTLDRDLARVTNAYRTVCEAAPTNGYTRRAT